MNKPKRVLCLGGGWVAIYLARTLRPAIKRGEVELTVVSRDNYSTIHGMIAEMLTCKVQPLQINASVRDLIAPAHLHNAEVVSIDLAKREVLTRRSLDGRAYPLQYDDLVLGLGSVEDLSRYAGIAEHTFPLKTFANCYRLRNHLLSALELASIETDPIERKRLLTFVVAGGNYAGVEVACDLVNYFQLLCRKRYTELKPDEFKVALLEIGGGILPELATRHPHLVRTAAKQVDRLGIDVRLNTALSAATADEAVLKSGERIATRTIITCTGMRPSPLLEKISGPKDKRGRIETDQHCRVVNAENVWAGGDCAAVPHPDGGSCPPLAHYAQNSGKTIGKNILRAMAGRPLKSYSFNGLGEACTLGHGYAIAHLKGIPACGWIAWIGWRFIILTMFVPSWRQRVRLMGDWFMTMILGRDIVNPKIDDHPGISHALYEAGQVVVEQNETRKFHYLVEAGELEMVSQSPNQEQLLKTFRPGEYLGHLTRPNSDCFVRARTRARLLAIEEDAADALSEVRPDLAALLKSSAPANDSPIIAPETGI
jgi:NADH:ubiquinone reductase (H+-translocating)